MAEAAVDPPNVQCGFCLREGELDNPKSLPCSHVHCQPCLTGNLGVNGILMCPWCSEVYDVPIDSLPSANLEDDSMSCDICIKRGKKNQSAVTYCTLCRKLFCVKHEESHDDTGEDHQKMTIAEYKTQAKRLEKRVCPKHTQFPYSLGCRGCVKLFCVQCVSGANLCDDGSSHQLINIDELIKELITADELFTTEDKLSALFKLVSRAVSDFNTETEELLDILHKQRDQQLAEVRLKYETLETEFLANRRKNKTELTRYMEEEVGTLWSNLSKSRMKIEAQLRQSHQVDIVQGYAEVKDKIQNLISVEIPRLELCDVMTLEVKGERRDIEVEVVPTTDISISLDEGMATYVLPKSLELIQAVDVSASCPSACMYQGKTYVGLVGGKIDRVNENYSLTKSFIAASNYVSGVTVYNDLLYVLVYGNPWRVNVYDLSGDRITSWNHGHSNTDINRLAVTDKKVVVPDRANKQLTLYTLTGEVVKHIACPLLSDNQTAICAADRHCVVVSDYNSSQVFKLDLTTEQVIWVSKDVPKPQGVTCYRSRYILVTNTSSSETTILILDVKTGELLSKLTDPANRESSIIYDLHVSGNTLIVPRYTNKKVLFYQLK